MVPGDDVGEMCMLGAHHPELQGVDEYTESQTTSSGKGLLQVEEVVLDTLKSLSPDDGVFMICRSKSGIDAVLDNEMGYVCWRDYSFEAQLTSERTFAPATNLKVSGSNLTWINPNPRYDFRKMILRFNAGSSAPATITAGTGGPAMDDDATTCAVVSGRAYALFAVYDDYHDTPADDKDVSPAEILIT